MPDEAAIGALNKLPFALVGRSTSFYPKKNFKLAPDWARAQKAAACVNVLVDATCGRGIRHRSMLSAVERWSATNDLSLTEIQVEDVAYSLRAIIPPADPKLTKPNAIE